MPPPPPPPEVDAEDALLKKAHTYVRPEVPPGTRPQPRRHTPPGALPRASTVGRTFFFPVAKKKNGWCTGFATFACEITRFGDFRRLPVLAVGPALGA